MEGRFFNRPSKRFTTKRLYPDFAAAAADSGDGIGNDNIG